MERMFDSLVQTDLFCGNRWVPETVQFERRVQPGLESISMKGVTILSLSLDHSPWVLESGCLGSNSGLDELVTSPSLIYLSCKMGMTITALAS